jgi:hypothetical protein
MDFNAFWWRLCPDLRAVAEAMQHDRELLVTMRTQVPPQATAERLRFACDWAIDVSDARLRDVQAVAISEAVRFIPRKRGPRPRGLTFAQIMRRGEGKRRPGRPRQNTARDFDRFLAAKAKAEEAAGHKLSDRGYIRSQVRPELKASGRRMSHAGIETVRQAKRISRLRRECGQLLRVRKSRK